MASSSPTSPFLFSRVFSAVGGSVFAMTLLCASTSVAEEPAKNTKRTSTTKNTASSATKNEKQNDQKEKLTSSPYPSVAEQLAEVKRANALKEAAAAAAQTEAKTQLVDVVKDDPTLPLPPPDDQMSGVLGPFFKSMFMLIVVLGIAWLTLHKGLGKLMTRAQVGKRMQVIEKTSLDQRRSLYLVAIDGKEFILGGGEGGVVFLRDVVAPSTSFSGALLGAQKNAPVSTPLPLPAEKSSVASSNGAADLKKKATGDPATGDITKGDTTTGDTATGDPATGDERITGALS